MYLLPFVQDDRWLSAEIAKRPELARHSIHFPLTNTLNPTLRMLRIVTEESEVLPSRERCPYLVFVELLEVGKPLRCGSAKLYTTGTYCTPIMAPSIIVRITIVDEMEIKLLL